MSPLMLADFHASRKSRKKYYTSLLCAEENDPILHVCEWWKYVTCGISSSLEADGAFS